MFVGIYDTDRSSIRQRGVRAGVITLGADPGSSNDAAATTPFAQNVPGFFLSVDDGGDMLDAAARPLAAVQAITSDPLISPGDTVGVSLTLVRGGASVIWQNVTRGTMLEWFTPMSRPILGAAAVWGVSVPSEAAPWNYMPRFASFFFDQAVYSTSRIVTQQYAGAHLDPLPHPFNQHGLVDTQTSATINLRGAGDTRTMATTPSWNRGQPPGYPRYVVRIDYLGAPGAPVAYGDPQVGNANTDQTLEEMRAQEGLAGPPDDVGGV
jgi:hypothetical protein